MQSWSFASRAVVQLFDVDQTTLVPARSSQHLNFWMDLTTIRMGVTVSARLQQSDYSIQSSGYGPCTFLPFVAWNFLYMKKRKCHCYIQFFHRNAGWQKRKAYNLMHKLAPIVLYYKSTNGRRESTFSAIK